jgi:hypothetical protein
VIKALVGLLRLWTQNFFLGEKRKGILIAANDDFYQSLLSLIFSSLLGLFFLSTKKGGVKVLIWLMVVF